MSLLSREQILEANDLTFEDVDVPEWGGAVRVMALTGWERDKFESAMVTGRGKNRTTNMDNLRAKMAAAALVDEAGARLFTESDVRVLGKKSAAALDRVFDVARRLSGLTQEDSEELAGNSEAAQSDSSTSD